MTPDAVMNAISTVGFPIAAYVMMWRLYSRTLTEQKQAFQEQAEAFRALRHEVKE